MENKELVTDQLLNEGSAEQETTPTQEQTASPEPETEALPEISADYSQEQKPMEEILPTDILTGEQAKEVEKEMTEVEKLIAKRTGFWEVPLDLEDVKWIKNACQGKFEFTGPNEAYFLITCYMGFAGALQRAQSEQKKTVIPVILQAAAIEACAMFINRFKGSTLESAQRLFRIAMAMNNVIIQLRDLDNTIEAMREAEKIAGEQPVATQSEQPQETEQPVDHVEPGS